MTPPPPHVPPESSEKVSPVAVAERVGVRKQELLDHVLSTPCELRPKRLNIQPGEGVRNALLDPVLAASQK